MCTAFTVIIWGSHSTGIGIEQTRVEKGYLFSFPNLQLSSRKLVSVYPEYLCAYEDFFQFKITIIIIIMSLKGLPG